MSPYVEQVMHEIFGPNLPKRFEDKTPEEQVRDRDRFLRSLQEMAPATDEQIDEIFLGGRMENLKLRIPDFTEDEAESA